jgi:hypothetical protein
MSRKTLKPIATLAAVLATAAVVPAASAANTDLRSPDARDAAGGAPAAIPATSTANTDLRSPDARDAARVVVVNNGQDLRSPDRRDAAPPSSTPVPSATPDNGTDWGEIGMITGAVVLALGSIGAALYITRRRGHVRKSAATAAPS